MRKITTLLTVFILGCSANAQIINFPDANFKAKLLSATASNGVAKNVAGFSIKVDFNNNGQIEQSEALLVYQLNFRENGGAVPFKMADTRISDLTGIAFFTNLRNLDVAGNKLTNLNLTSNTQLRTLDCYNNLITAINLTGLTNLLSLNVSANMLTSLNTSIFPNLTALYCYSNSNLSTLNLLSNTQLKSLNCRYNNMSNLNLTNNTLLLDVDCSHNLLTNLNLSTNTSSTYIDCSYNLFSTINVSNNNQLRYLYCQNNQLTTLNLTTNTLLSTLNCKSNQLTTLNLTTNTALNNLDCGFNQINSLVLNAATTLQQFSFGSNLITSLNLTNYNSLQTFTCDSNPITSLVFGNNTQLSSVSIINTTLETLDFSQTSVTKLICNNNPNLYYINLKNTIVSDEYYFDNFPAPGYLAFQFGSLPALNHICSDNGEITILQNATQSMSGVNIGDFCSPDSRINLSVIIQGNYSIASHAMQPVKYNQGMSSNQNYSDDIIVELRNTNGTLKAATTAQLQTNGSALVKFTSAPSGSYYIVVKHRNSIETWSSNPVTIGSTPLAYNFTNTSSKAYGNNMIQVESGVFAIYSGDLNQDQVIDNSDATNLINDIENSAFGNLPTDLNGDGSVDNSDLTFLLNNAMDSVFSVHP
jgi:Leucine-rich repeat (LRR) protein